MPHLAIIWGTLVLIIIIVKTYQHRAAAKAKLAALWTAITASAAGVACAALLIGGIWCVEGDYQTFMRISVCLWGIVTAYKLQRAKATPWATLAAIGIAILYNPIHPIHFDGDWEHSFDSDTWLPVNIAAAISSIILTRLAWGAPDKR